MGCVANRNVANELEAKRVPVHMPFTSCEDHPFVPRFCFIIKRLSADILVVWNICVAMLALAQCTLGSARENHLVALIMYS